MRHGRLGQSNLHTIKSKDKSKAFVAIICRPEQRSSFSHPQLNHIGQESYRASFFNRSLAGGTSGDRKYIPPDSTPADPPTQLVEFKVKFWVAEIFLRPFAFLECANLFEIFETQPSAMTGCPWSRLSMAWTQSGFCKFKVFDRPPGFVLQGTTFLTFCTLNLKIGVWSSCECHLDSPRVGAPKLARIFVIIYHNFW